MSVKTTGAEFKRFYDDKAVWGEKGWCDDFCLEVDGREFGDGDYLDVSSLSDSSKVKIISGMIFDGPEDGDESDMIVTFRKWKKSQSVIGMVIEVEKDRLDEVLAILKSNRIKVLT